LPMLEIEPLRFNPTQLQAALSDLKHADYVFITSQNGIPSHQPELLDALKMSKIISMGEATTQALMQHRCQVFFTAPPGSSSESLLNESWLQAREAQNKKIILMTGIGGRVLLSQMLQARGAQVQTLEVYRQLQPQIDLSIMQYWQQSNDSFCFIATSANIVRNLIALTPTQNQAWLKQQTLVVISDRIRQLAIESGFKQIILATSASPAHIGLALRQLGDIWHTE
jgi:uroporphyrinogen-III synthase